MDYNKIGKFIMEERKAKKLTQSKLAEKIFVSEKTISKWENGNGIPDTNILPKLCEVLDISINELLNGERISAENYEASAERTLFELQKAKQERDRMLLSMEIVIVALSIIILLSSVLVASLVLMQTWIRIVLIIFGVLTVLISASFALKIEQKAGYYVCKRCEHKYIPTFKQVFVISVSLYPFFSK